MATHHESATQGRRNFLKAAGSAGIAFVAAKNAQGQNANPEATIAGRESLDRGLWITWYNLPESGRDAYLAWLHETYLPNLLKRAGYLWAAHYATRSSGGSAQIHHVDDPKVPTGFHYILIVGVKDALVFGNPVPSAIHASLPEQGRKMLAMRTGERVNLMVEAGRCEGRASSLFKEGLTGAPCIQITPAISSSGCRRCVRLRRVSGRGN